MILLLLLIFFSVFIILSLFLPKDSFKNFLYVLFSFQVTFLIWRFFLRDFISLVPERFLSFLILFFLIIQIINNTQGWLMKYLNKTFAGLNIIKEILFMKLIVNDLFPLSIMNFIVYYKTRTLFLCYFFMFSSLIVLFFETFLFYEIKYSLYILSLNIIIFTTIKDLVFYTKYANYFVLYCEITPVPDRNLVDFLKEVPEIYKAYYYGTFFNRILNFCETPERALQAFEAFNNSYSFFLYGRYADTISSSLKKFLSYSYIYQISCSILFLCCLLLDTPVIDLLTFIFILIFFYSLFFGYLLFFDYKTKMLEENDSIVGFQLVKFMIFRAKFNERYPGNSIEFPFFNLTFGLQNRKLINLIIANFIEKHLMKI